MINRIDGTYIRMAKAMLDMGMDVKEVRSRLGLSRKFLEKIRKKVKWSDFTS